MTSLYVRGILQQQETVALAEQMEKDTRERDVGREADYFWVMMFKTP